MEVIIIAIRNFFLGFYLFLLKNIINPRKLIYIISTQLFYEKTLSNRGRFEQINIDQHNFFQKSKNEGFNYNLSLNTKSYFWANDPSYLKDLLTLCIAIKVTNAQTIFEIGTFNGYTTYHLALNSMSAAKIYSLDLPKGNRVNLKLSTTKIDDNHINLALQNNQYFFHEFPEKNKISLLYGDSATFDYSDYLNKVDLFFIDGSHSYEYVRSDTINAIKCTKNDGLVLWHDYGRMGINGVTKWLNEFSKSGNKIYSVPGSSIAFHIVKK